MTQHNSSTLPRLRRDLGASCVTGSLEFQAQRRTEAEGSDGERWIATALVDRTRPARQPQPGAEGAR